jgi:hypothetical protein
VAISRRTGAEVEATDGNRAHGQEVAEDGPVLLGVDRDEVPPGAGSSLLVEDVEFVVLPPMAGP